MARTLSKRRPQMDHRFFRILPDDGGIEVDEQNGNAFQLGPIIRKYTPAKLIVKGATRHTKVELSQLFDALGLLRSLQHDARLFNAASGTPCEVRYAAYRLTRQGAAFGVRVPRASSGATVDVPGLDELIAYVEGAFSDRIACSRATVAGGIVDFESLAELFVPGRDVLDRGLVTGLFGVSTALRVRSGYYSRGRSIFGVVSTYFVALECVVAVGTRFAVVEATLPVPEFIGTRSTTEGLEQLVELSESVRVELVARGAAYARMHVGGGASFLEYSPGSFLSVAGGGTGVGRAPARARGAGRIMIDSAAAWSRGVHAARSEGVGSDAVKAVLKLAAQRARSNAGISAAAAGAAGGQAAAAAEEESLELLLLSSLPPSLHHLTWPVVAGFSFSAKAWGVAHVAGLCEVNYNSRAFEQLQLPADRKKLIRALVHCHEQNATSASAGGRGYDIIAGKGEGLIFLLHGPPGVGKTLTAEAVAEFLQRPLYVVSMGELGTSPEVLEERLSHVFDLCAPWRAIVLIDEADMLLERRTKNDIVRNAMVCVMLRLLEYYQGILFLTTNRVDSLDPAFQSRVQCALRYEPLDVGARARVWESCLARAPGGARADVIISELAALELNGRQVKNVVQLAAALTLDEGGGVEEGGVGMAHLRAMVALTGSFTADSTGGSRE